MASQTVFLPNFNVNVAGAVAGVTLWSSRIHGPRFPGAAPLIDGSLVVSSSPAYLTEARFYSTYSGGNADVSRVSPEVSAPASATERVPFTDKVLSNASAFTLEETVEGLSVTLPGTFHWIFRHGRLDPYSGGMPPEARGRLGAWVRQVGDYFPTRGSSGKIFTLTISDEGDIGVPVQEPVRDRTWVYNDGSWKKADSIFVFTGGEWKSWIGNTALPEPSERTANVNVSVSPVSRGVSGGDKVAIGAAITGDYDTATVSWSGDGTFEDASSAYTIWTAPDSPGDAVIRVRVDVTGTGTNAKDGTTASATDSETVEVVATPATGNRQTLNLGAVNVVENPLFGPTFKTLQWSFPQGARLQMNTHFGSGWVDMFEIEFQTNANDVSLDLRLFSGNAGFAVSPPVDLPESWEDSGSMVLTIGGNSVTIPGSNNADNVRKDGSNRYQWAPSVTKQGEIARFARGVTDGQTATLEFVG